MSKPMIRTNADRRQAEASQGWRWDKKLTISGDTNVEVVATATDPQTLADLEAVRSDLAARGYTVSAITTR